MSSKLYSPILAALLICGLLVCLSYNASSLFSGAIVLAGSGNVASTENLSVSSSSVNWGTIAPGASVTKALTVSNVGNCPLKLGLAVSDWSPSLASEHLSVAWNCTDFVLGISESVNAVLTLNVPNSAVLAGINEFNNRLIISGIEV